MVKNKIFGLMAFVVLLCSVSFVVPAHAGNTWDFTYICIYWNGGSYGIACSYAATTVNYTNNNGYFTVSSKVPSNAVIQMACNRWNDYYTFATVEGAVNFLRSGEYFYTVNYFGGATEIITYSGTSYTSNPNKKFHSTYNDYLESIKPKWYETLWDTFKDYMTNPVPFGWFTDLIDKVFGDDKEEGPISHAVTIRNPTLAPTPTPIPYSTVVIPKTDIITGDTVYETNYYYVNPSGTPIVTSSPPTNSPATGGGGGGSTEYNPINGDPYSLPYLDWLSNADIGDNDYNGIDSIGDGMSAIDDVGSEYANGMSAVQDSTGTLPTSWLMLIGIAAAIPLLAGIISRFLGG